MLPANASPGSAYRTNARVGPRDTSPRELVEVIVVWGGDDVVMASYLTQGERFTLATTADRRHTFAHPDHAGAPRALVEFDLDRCTVHDPSRGSFALPERDAVEVGVGDFTFRVRRVVRSERLPAQKRDRLLGIALPLALVCTAVVGGVTRRVERSLTVDDDDTQRQWITTHIDRERWRAHPPTDPPPDDVPHAQRRWQQAPQRGPVVSEAPMRRATGLVDVAAVQRRGIFASLGQVGLVPSVFPLPGVHDESRATGAMYGTSVGDSFGYAGLGLTGTGWGGGAHASDLVGLGRIRTRGHGSDDGTGQGAGGGGGACGCGEAGEMGRGIGRAAVGRLIGRATRITCTLGVSPALMEEGYPAEHIRRVVVRNLGQVRHCYQQALETNAGASGRLSVRWVIGADGQVMGAGVESNDTGVASLGDCVTSAVRRWQFPPPSAGVVTVTYPFTLDVAE
jgi:hypothetical protein